MTHNVLFLDFDGPLTNAKAFKKYDKSQGRMMWTTADPWAIRHLNDLCAKHDVRVVLSTSWRYGEDRNPTGLSAIDSLRHWGFQGKFHDDDRTPRVFSGDRSREIYLWFKDNIHTVKNYASLDDSKLDDWINNVQVHPSNGATEQDWKTLDSYLSGYSGTKVDSLYDKPSFGFKRK